MNQNSELDMRLELLLELVAQGATQRTKRRCEELVRRGFSVAAVCAALARIITERLQLQPPQSAAATAAPLTADALERLVSRVARAIPEPEEESDGEDLLDEEEEEEEDEEEWEGSEMGSFVVPDDDEPKKDRKRKI